MLPEEPYIDFLVEQQDHIHSVHFSICSPYRLDGRYLLDPCSQEEKLSVLLQQLGRVKKYGLLNSRFLAKRFYSDSSFLSDTCERLNGLLDSANIDGLVYNDHYLLQALADYSPDTASALEAVPGVNSQLITFEEIALRMDYIGGSGFRLPQKLILDRAVNRNFNALKIISEKCRASYPDLHLELLANEGCLLHCPFKLSHDAHISLANSGLENDIGLELNKKLGCMAIFDKEPERIFQSPFIRPEDVDHYLPFVSGIKLCGRTIGSSFLMDLITAYINRCYEGNMLSLFDTLEWLAQSLHIDNHRLPKDFLDTLANCDNNCSQCRYCQKLADKCRPLKMSLPDLRR